MPLYELKTLEGQLDETLLTERLIALLSAGFGLVATLLAAIGLYGVIAFAVARRAKGLGLRVGLGGRAPRESDRSDAGAAHRMNRGECDGMGTQRTQRKYDLSASAR